METTILYWIPIERLALIADVPVLSLYDESFNIELTKVNDRDFVFVNDQIIKIDWDYSEKHNSFPTHFLRIKAEYHGKLYPAVTILEYTGEQEKKRKGEQEKGRI